MGIRGTGFFVDDNGHFLTAHHVIAEAPSGSEILYGGNIPHKHTAKLVKINAVNKNDAKDLFLGKVKNEPLPKVNIAEQTPAIGTSVCLCGYPLARLGHDPKTGIKIDNVRQYWQPTFLIDFARGTVNNRNYNGFITQDTSLPGMSGGPVFDKYGKVCGMDVATFTREISKSDRPKDLLKNGLAIKVEEIKDFLANTIK